MHGSEAPARIRRHGRDALREVLMVDASAERRVPLSSVLLEFGVDGLIRLRQHEFAALDRTSTRFAHFNLQRSGHRPAARYLVVPIVRAGFFREGGEERLPLLDVSRGILGRCLEVEHDIPYEELKPRHFEHSLSHIRDPDQLQAAILARYGESLPDLSPRRLLRAGVAYTLLELLPREEAFS